MKQFIYFSLMAGIMLISFGSCSKDDESVKVEGVMLNKSVLNLVEDESETLVATVTPSNADNKACSWRSSDTGTATVSDNGKVTAVRKGETTITVTTADGGKTASCRVIVEPKYIAVTDIRLSETSVVLHAGESHSLTAQVLPEEATDKSMTWKSSNESIATIDANGVVSAVKTGSTTIMASAENGKVTASCKVVVESTAVTGVSIPTGTLSLVVGEANLLSYEITPENADDKSVTWSVEDESIAKIGADGKVTALKIGQTTATVRTNDGGYTDKCLINVAEITEYMTGNVHHVGDVIINGTVFHSKELTIDLINNSNVAITINSVQVLDGDTHEARNVINIGPKILEAKQTYFEVLRLSDYVVNPIVRWRFEYNGTGYVFDCGLTQ